MTAAATATIQHATTKVAAIVRAGVSYVADIIARMIGGLGELALVVAVGCAAPGCTGESSSAAEPAAAPQPALRALSPIVAAHAGEPARATAAEPRSIGAFEITFYYVIGEDEVVAKAKAKPANDNAPADSELTAIAEDAPQVTLYDGDQCTPIANVTPEFASQLALQGTGKLRDGRVLNIWGHCRCGHTPCFRATGNQWGTAGTGRPLQPFRTVAVDPKVVKLGSLLYVPLLEGRTMPGRAPWGGYVHDGCVVADDVGGGIDGNQLDLFVGRKAYFLGLSGSQGSHAWARHVPVYDGSAICERRGRVVARKSGAI